LLLINAHQQLRQHVLIVCGYGSHRHCALPQWQALQRQSNAKYCITAGIVILLVKYDEDLRRSAIISHCPLVDTGAGMC